MKIVFTTNSDGTYDLTVDGRTIEHDVEPDDFQDALHRARVLGQASVDSFYVEDESGYQERHRL